MGRYALLKRYEIMRDEFVFPEKLPLAYAYPRKRPLPVVYRGIGREERDLYDSLSENMPKEAGALIRGLEEGSVSFPFLWNDRGKTLLYASAFHDAEDYECIFIATHEEDAPAGLVFLGYDAGYPPEEELFSAVSDLFFFPVWLPDASGDSFLAAFRSLNENGLFRNTEAAESFAASYKRVFGDDALIPMAVYALP